MPTQFGVVLGCPRSGTTFLMQVLETAHEAACVTGNLWPICLPHLLNQPLDPAYREVLQIGFKKAMTDYLESGQHQARFAALRKWARARPGLGQLPAAFRGRQPGDHILYKEPFLSFTPGFVYEALPDCRIVHIVRDGRDCANSLVRSYDVMTDEKLTSLAHSEMMVGRRVDHRYVPWWVAAGQEAPFLEASPYVRAVWMWKAMVSRCRLFFERPEILASGRVLQVHYEDLMQEPQTWGQRVAAHLGVRYTGQMSRVLRQAHTDSIGKFRRRDSEEVRRATAVAEEELVHYGYAL